jgi:sugar phosphate isomerase/epimerase
MKLSVSNIAWNAAEDEVVFDRLSGLGVGGVEVAPSRIWPDWQGATPQAARALATEFEGRGLVVPAFQAILFGRPELQVFGSPEVQQALVDHVSRVAELAAAFGAKVMVFGSPKNRDPGGLPADVAEGRAAELFHRVAERCAPFGVCLCLEPNPRVYACTFMTSYRDVLNMVERVNHPALGVHLDVACIQLEGDSVVEAVRAAAGRIRHFHVTEPNLGDFAAPSMPHREAGQALREARYDNWLSIEMRRSDAPLLAIETAVHCTRKHYDAV